MSFLVCPLCGKSSSMRKFNPEDYDLDIYAQDMVGLGKGKGFAVTGKYSILDGNSHVIQMIKDRVLDILLLLYESDIVTQEEIINRFNIKSVSDEHRASKALLEEKTKRINFLSGELSSARADLEELKQRLEDILVDIENELGPEYRLDESDPIKELKFAIERLIEEYRALRARVEELG